MSEDWQRLAAYVVHDRTASGCRTRGDFARASGISYRTLGDLESGRRVARTTLALAESALGWQPGSATSVLSGGAPRYTSESAADNEVEDATQSDDADLAEASMDDLIRVRRVIARVQGTDAADDFLRNALRLQEQIRNRRKAHGA